MTTRKTNKQRRRTFMLRSNHSHCYSKQNSRRFTYRFGKRFFVWASENQNKTQKQKPIFPRRKNNSKFFFSVLFHTEIHEKNTKGGTRFHTQNTALLPPLLASFTTTRVSCFPRLGSSAGFSADLT